jgi:hypothetical protein
VRGRRATRERRRKGLEVVEERTVRIEKKRMKVKVRVQG